MQTIIAVDGLSGVGKDTFIDHLKYRLELDFTKKVYLTREPTDDFYGERALTRLKHGKNDMETVLLMLADRYVHMNNFLKECEPESIVIINRYGLSTFVYQGDMFFSLISEAHKHFVIPHLTVVIDASHKQWLDGNREWLYDTKGLDNSIKDDRGRYREKLKSEEEYEELREKYTSRYPYHVTGFRFIIDGFDDLDVMVDKVMPHVIRAIDKKIPAPSYIVERELLYKEVTSNPRTANSHNNKKVMGEIEKKIIELIRKNNKFKTDTVHALLPEYDTGKLIGNVIKRLLNRGYIKRIIFNGVIRHYCAGKNFNEWASLT
jgi:thymidylate kinase